jgi:hypothetical protein
VEAGGKTYSAAGTLFTSYPSISAPASGATVVGVYTTDVRWSDGAPADAALSYDVGVLDAADPNESLVWPP